MSTQQQYLNAEQVAVLVGVTVEEVRAWATTNGTHTMPAAWVESGQRRSARYKVHTGRDDVYGAIEWLAAQDAR